MTSSSITSLDSIRIKYSPRSRYQALNAPYAVLKVGKSFEIQIQISVHLFPLPDNLKS
jgi:hypothetical protein